MIILERLTDFVTDSKGTQHFFALIERQYHHGESYTWCMVVDNQVIPHLSMPSSCKLSYEGALNKYLNEHNLKIIVDNTETNI